MAIADILGSVIMSYKANTDDFIAELKKLKGAQADQAKSALDGLESQSKGLQGLKDDISAVQAEFRAVQTVFETVWGAMKLKQSEIRKEFAATGIDINGLSNAFGGLKTHMEVLDFAAKANQSSFKLTNGELQLVAQATRALTERGFDATEAQNKLTDALVTGRTKGLAEYGIVMRGTGETVDQAGDKLSRFEKSAGNVTETLQQLSGIAATAGQGVGAYGEDADRAAVTFQDAWTKAKESLSSVGEAMIPLVTALAGVVSSLASIVELAAKLPLGAASAIPGAGGYVGSSFSSALKGGPTGEIYRQFDTEDLNVKKIGDALSAQWTKDSKILSDRAQAQTDEAFKVSFGKTLGGYVDSVKELAKGIDESASAHLNSLTGAVELEREASKKSAEAAAEAWKKQHELILKLINEQLKADTDNLIARLESDLHPNTLDRGPHTNFDSDPLIGPLAARGVGYAPPNSVIGQIGQRTDNGMTISNLGYFGNRQVSEAQDQATGPGNQLGSAFTAEAAMRSVYANKLSAVTQSGNTDMLSKVFGPLDKFDLYTKAFAGLTSAVTAGFNAWIEGSQSAAKAFRGAIGHSLEALADQMLAESLKYGAYALGSLVIGDPRAAGYATTAAEFAAGAAVAGVLAHELIGGGSSSSAASGAHSVTSVPTGNSSSGPNGSGPIIVVGDNFADDSPRQRQASAQRLYNLATGKAQSGYSS